MEKFKRFKDETGKTYGRLTVLGREIPNRKEQNQGVGLDGKARWLCRCECGKTRIVPGDALRRGATQSCGCLQRERVGVAARTHGQSQSFEYRAWQQAKNRCDNPRNARYASYGGRGITMIEAWRNDFTAFIAHIGPKPDGRVVLDRIENDGNYEPGNVHWATFSESNGNKRHTKNGITYPPSRYEPIEKPDDKFERLRAALRARDKLKHSLHP